MTATKDDVESTGNHAKWWGPAEPIARHIVADEGKSSIEDMVSETVVAETMVAKAVVAETILASSQGVGNAGDEYRWPRHIGIATPNDHGQINCWSPKDSRRADGAAKDSILSQRRLSIWLMNVV
jgi:hypothetical protein